MTPRPCHLAETTAARLESAPRKSAAYRSKETGTKTVLSKPQTCQTCPSNVAQIAPAHECRKCPPDTTRAHWQWVCDSCGTATQVLAQVIVSVFCPDLLAEAMSDKTKKAMKVLTNTAASCPRRVFLQRACSWPSGAAQPHTTGGDVLVQTRGTSKHHSGRFEQSLNAQSAWVGRSCKHAALLLLLRERTDRGHIVSR